MRRRLANLLVIDPRNWRAGLLSLILQVGVVLGVVVYVPSVYMASENGFIGVVVVDTVALLGVVLLSWFGTIPFRWRASAFCLICYALGTTLMFSVGSVSQIYLFGFSILTAILLGPRSGFAAAVLSAGTMLLVGYLGQVADEMRMAPMGHTFPGWVVITLNFALVNTLLTVAIGVVLAATDQALTREIAAHHSLDSQRKLLRTLLDALPDIVFTKDMNCRYALVNPRTLAEVGIESEDQMVGKTDYDFFPKEFADRFRADDLQVLAGKPLVDREERSVDAGGNQMCYWTIKVPLRDESGAIVGLMGISRDITSRKRSEAERNRLLAQLRLQIERMPLGYLLSDANFRYTRWNPAAERMFGYKEAEVLGKHPFEVIVPEASQTSVAEIFDRIRAGHMDAHGVSKNRTKSDGTITCEWYNTPLFDEDGAFVGLLSLAQDITDRKRLEEQLQQSQKMEAFGQLAGGVAHDFNNLLTVINGYSELVLRSLPASDPNRGLIAEIFKAGERSASLTRQLLAFSRQQVMAPRVLDLNSVVTDAEKMLRRLIGEDVKLVTNLTMPLPAVRADPGQLEQVLLNLVVNARDSMPTGGALTIETGTVVLGDEFAQTHPGIHPGPHVLLAVSDTGCGMPPEIKSRIFEPFFTTKGPGKGTGLGLATVLGIVQQSGGTLEVSSEVGMGSIFKVYLPWVDETPVGSAASVALQAPRGTETVLLVEDEAALRALSRQILTSCGYNVLEAANGEQAKKVVEGYRKPIHLLVTDVVMPGVGGRIVAERVTKSHPGLRVLFVSGYTDDAVVRHGVFSEGTNFLQKPFSSAALALKVREVLDAPLEAERTVQSSVSATPQK
ncbi:MAG: hybrid sensor histidine kinase/response regulator [Planctomycetaceae bacterium]|nr:hybrid sensor histidine kinase/response regulator [Planctomycetaceae bacterium]